LSHAQRVHEVLHCRRLDLFETYNVDKLRGGVRDSGFIASEMMQNEYDGNGAATNSGKRK